eukprot:35891_1
MLEFNCLERQIKILKCADLTSKLQNGEGTIMSMRSSSYPETADLLPLCCTSDDGAKRIDVCTLTKLMEGEYSELIDHFAIIDCRYGYEYNNGHIQCAVNVQSQQLLELMFKTNLKHSDKRIAWIFHCEYSQKRGPRAASNFKRLDREHNQRNYPNLCFPHTYVLDGGYKKYHETSPISTTYVSMFSPDFDAEMTSCNKMDKILWPQKRKSRKTFKSLAKCVVFIHRLKSSERKHIII